MTTPGPIRAALENVTRRVQRTPAHRGWYIDHEPDREGDWMHDENEPCPVGICAALAQPPTPPAPVAPMEGITPKEWDAFEAATGTVERCVYPGCTLRDDKGQCAECDRERDHWVHGSDVKFNAGHPFRPQPTPLTDEALRARGEFEAYLFGHLSACAPSDSVFRQVWASMLRHLDNLAAALAARQEGS